MGKAQRQTLKIVIKGELPDLNTEINMAKKHWSYYSKQKKYWTNYCKLTTLGAMKGKRPELDYPVHISFKWYAKNRRKDPDNIAFAKKYILDGFIAAGLLENDGMKQVLGFGDEFEVDDNPRVEVTIN